MFFSAGSARVHFQMTHSRRGAACKTGPDGPSTRDPRSSCVVRPSVHTCPSRRKSSDFPSPWYGYLSGPPVFRNCPRLVSSPKEVHEGFVCWKRGHLLSRLAHHSDDFAHGLVRSILVSNDQLHQTCHRQLLDFCALESKRGHEVHFSNSLLGPLCSPSSYSS